MAMTTSYEISNDFYSTFTELKESKTSIICNEYLIEYDTILLKTCSTRTFISLDFGSAEFVRIESEFSLLQM